MVDPSAQQVVDRLAEPAAGVAAQMVVDVVAVTFPPHPTGVCSSLRCLEMAASAGPSSPAISGSTRPVRQQLQDLQPGRVARRAQQRDREIAAAIDARIGRDGDSQWPANGP